MMNRRFYLYLRGNKTFFLKDASGAWARRFSTLLQSLHYVIALDPDTSSRLTVFDSGGRRIVDTFV
jgi:hypothetical protein